VYSFSLSSLSKGLGRPLIAEHGNMSRPIFRHCKALRVAILGPKRIRKIAIINIDGTYDIGG
jgi:hypothetical protein